MRMLVGVIMRISMGVIMRVLMGVIMRMLMGVIMRMLIGVIMRMLIMWMRVMIGVLSEHRAGKVEIVMKTSFRVSLDENNYWNRE